MSMKKFYAVLLILLTALVVNAQAQDPVPLRLAQTIPLPKVEGRIDHLAVDVKGQRLFVAALGNNTLEILDLRAAKRIRTIAGLREPQGVIFLLESNKIFVTNGQGGTCDIFDGTDFKLIDSVKSLDDADNIRYDSATKHIYVGYGNGALSVLDASNGQRLGDIKLAGHPESFQLESLGPRIFVNVPKAKHIAVIDRKRRAVVATWLLADAQANFPMALDEAGRRLFVGFRKPARLTIFDTESGKAVAGLDSVGDADDIFYDIAHKRVYMSGGEGFIGVFEQGDADHYKRIAKIPTASGARTSLFVPELGRLYLAVPHRGRQGAEMRVYEVKP